jgi:hypothetical protein
MGQKRRRILLGSEFLPAPAASELADLATVDRYGMSPRYWDCVTAFAWLEFAGFTEPQLVQGQ